MPNFKDISYLKQGNNRQKEAYKTLVNLNICEILVSHSPVLTGTIPINIDIENSDLDIICYCKDLEEFQELLIKNFKTKPDFEINRKNIKNSDTIVARFTHNQFLIEVFGQNRPIEDQEAYQHMIIEHRLLIEKGESFREQIIELKKQGYKTEPAFAKLLEIKGDPFLELLKY